MFCSCAGTNVHMRREQQKKPEDEEKEKESQLVLYIKTSCIKHIIYRSVEEKNSL